jgi:hypothetical protein
MARDIIKKSTSSIILLENYWAQGETFAPNSLFFAKFRRF